MEKCRICLLAVVDSFTPVRELFGKYTLAEMIAFISGVEIEINDKLPQVVCSHCLPQIKAACEIKRICISSDKTLREQIFIQSLDGSTVKIESEPDIFHVDTVKDEPYDETDNYCNVEYLKYSADPMQSVREYFPDPRYPQERSRHKYKTSTVSRAKKELPAVVKCFLCSEEFQTRKGKVEHLEAVHSNDEFKCRLCKHKSQTARGLDNHVMLHENPELLSHMCHICSKNYQKACELRRHIKLSHSDKTLRVSNFFCDFCDFKTFSKMNVKRHLRTIHLKIKAFQCKFCPDKKYTSKVTLDQHMITKHGQETDYICRCCGRKFPTMSFLRSHMKSTCSGSPGAVRERGDPNEYRQQIGETDSYRCKICSVICLGKGKIAQHYAQRHKHDNKCELCTATFNSYSNLKKHIQILHNKIHKFECSFCGKRFGQKNQLQSHENTHTGAKPFQCKFEYCQFRSGDLSAVSKHQKKCSHNPINMG